MAIFSEVVNPWFYSKNGQFSIFFFRQYRTGKSLLRYSRTAKTPFQAIRTRSSKSRKMAIFSKALTHGFGPKMIIFPKFFFKQYRRGKCLLRYSRTRKTPFQTIKARSSKSRKIDIFSKGVNPCLWCKNGHFSNFLFQALLGRKMSFTIFQNEKTPFQAVRTRSSKSRKWPFFQSG